MLSRSSPIPNTRSTAITLLVVHFAVDVSDERSCKYLVKVRTVLCEVKLGGPRWTVRRARKWWVLDWSVKVALEMPGDGIHSKLHTSK